PDGHSGTNHSSAADPNVRADGDGLAVLLLPPPLSVHRVGGGVNLDRRPEEREVADRYTAHVEDHTVEVEEDPLPQQDVRAVVAEERRLHPAALATGPEEFLQDAAAAFLVGVAGGVEILAQVPGALSGTDQF